LPARDVGLRLEADVAILIVPEVREWVIERIERGTLQRIEVGVNSPVRNLSRKGPQSRDDGLAVNIVATGVTVRPADDMPVVARRRPESPGDRPHRDGQHRSGDRRYADRSQDDHFGFCFRGAGHGTQAIAYEDQVPHRRQRAGAAEILASDRLSEFSGTLIDPNSSKGNMSPS